MMKIAPEAPFPAEFLQVARPILEKTPAGRRASALELWLGQREVNLVENYPDPSWSPTSTVMPLWYYMDWLRSQYRLHFPQVWAHSQ